MCFSAEASFIGAAVIGTVGYFTLSEVTHKRQLFLATLPGLFALQQACEGVLWVFLKNNVEPNFFYWLCAFAFMWFSYIMWPAWFSLSSWALETVPWRRKVLTGLLALGVAESILGAWYVLQSGVHPNIVGNSIFYLQGSKFLGISYLVAVSLPFLLSSARYLWIIGAAAPISFAISAYIYYQNFASVWCFFAAILSVIIYFVIRADSQRKRAVRR